MDLTTGLPPMATREAHQDLSRWRRNGSHTGTISDDKGPDREWSTSIINFFCLDFDPRLRELPPPSARIRCFYCFVPPVYGGVLSSASGRSEDRTEGYAGLPYRILRH